MQYDLLDNIIGGLFGSNPLFKNLLPQQPRPQQEPLQQGPQMPQTRVALEGYNPLGQSKAQNAGDGNVFIMKQNPQGGFTRLIRPADSPFTAEEQQVQYKELMPQPTPQPVAQTFSNQLQNHRQQQQVSNSPMSFLQNTFIPKQAQAQEPTSLDKLMNSIAIQESGGRYNAVSPVNRNGSRAYGKYQVLGSNIPSWTRDVLGYSMTPEQFLNNPEAQEKVARAKIGNIYNQYGNPSDVASVWFSGRPMRGNNSTDITGKSVPSYIRDILSRL